MRILVVGAEGMLGTDALRLCAASGHDARGTCLRPAAHSALSPLNITDSDAVRRTLADWQPEVVWNCAAYTNVDGCERDPDTAFRVNAFGAWTIAAAAEEVGAALVHVSTDFVFDGEHDAPYTEWDTPNPINVYGASKWAGEQSAREACRRTYLVRTSWLYGAHGSCFPATMLRFARERGELFVVADQSGSPTYTVDLAQAILGIMETPLYGTYHVCNAGTTTWHGFAEAVLARAGLENVPVHAVTSEEDKARRDVPTLRPRRSVLRRYVLELQERDTLRPWPAALDAYFQEHHD